MQTALTLGRRGLGQTWPNPAVGAVVVRDGLVVGRGWTQPGGRPHAETEALGRAGAAARGATLYVTLEPCCHHGRTPPCTDAIIAAGIGRVVSAIEDPNPQVAGQGHDLLRQASVKVAVGEGADAARRDHAGHIRRVRDGRPHVTLKLAASADGKAGLTGRRPASITSEASRERAHLMRAMNDAVLTGIGTVLSDDPQLTCRLPGMAARSPVRVVLDTGLRIPLTSQLLGAARAAPLWIIAGPDASHDAERMLRQHGAEVLRAPLAGASLDIAAVLRLLSVRGITRVMVEAGPILASAFLAAGVVDVAVLFQSAAPLGDDGIAALEGRSLDDLTRSARFIHRTTESIGTDTMTIYDRAE